MQKSIAQALKSIILANKGKFFSVTFVKADQSLRTLNGQIGFKDGHDGENTVAHIPKYITVVENAPGDQPGKPKFRNVNTTTITRIAIAGTEIVINDNKK